MSSKKNRKEEFPVVAERALVLHDRISGVEQPIRVAVGVPYWVEAGKRAACALAIHGACGRLPDVEGVDTFQVLMFAIGLLGEMLETMPPQLEVRWPDGTPYFAADAVFGPGPTSLQ